MSVRTGSEMSKPSVSEGRVTCCLSQPRLPAPELVEFDCAQTATQREDIINHTIPHPRHQQKHHPPILLLNASTAVPPSHELAARHAATTAHPP